MSTELEELERAFARVVAERDTMADTLTRCQERGTALVTENRKLKVEMQKWKDTAEHHKKWSKKFHASLDDAATEEEKTQTIAEGPYFCTRCKEHIYVTEERKSVFKFPTCPFCQSVSYVRSGTE